MRSHRPSIDDLRRAIAENVGRDRLTIYDIAGAAGSSRSQIQRVFDAADTSYTQELRHARLNVAVRELVQERHSAARAAREAGISRDHLGVLLRQDLGLNARQIIRARGLEDRIRRWRREVVPRAGTSLYYQRRLDWLAADDELRGLLEDISAESPLADWAKQTLLLAARPDFRTAPYRSIVRRQRREVDAEHSARLMEFLREAAEGPRETSMSLRRDRVKT